MSKKILKSRALPMIIVLAGVAMMYHGYKTGEVQVVLDKAISICMECIGIG